MPSMLIFNAGSSSLKVSAAEGEDIVYSTQIDIPPLTMTEEQWIELLANITSRTGRFEAVVHRVVHGGRLFGSAAIIDDTVMRGIEALTDMAPLHQPPSVAVLKRLRQLLPDCVQIACFDTAFHAQMPAEAYTYAVPKEWREKLGVRRYGFHGLAHEYNAIQGAKLIGAPVEDLRIISAHLGSGASLAAIRDGRSIDTTMGFTPLEGLVMSTRSGSVDPALSAWLVSHSKLSVGQVIRRFEQESGFQGLAGDTHMGHVLDRAQHGDEEAKLAIDVWAHRAAAMTASMTASLQGVDLMVFSGGIGENAPDARDILCDRLHFLGIELDAERNYVNEMDSIISPEGASTKVVVVKSREDLTMVRQATRLLRETY